MAILPFAVSRFRDLTLIDIPNELSFLVVATDSFGGIGPKENDCVKVDGYELGKKIIRVPMMELLAIGATPLVVIDNLGVEMEPTGREIIAGIKDEMKRLNIDPDNCINGSTEDNITTIQTFAGVVAIGVMTKDEFWTKSIVVNDVAVCIGRPKSGPKEKISLIDSELVKYEDLVILNESKLVRDMLPVGSHGIAYELQQMAATRGRTVRMFDTELDVCKSAGIATCLLAAVASENLNEVRRSIETELTVMGEFT